MCEHQLISDTTTTDLFALIVYENLPTRSSIMLTLVGVIIKYGEEKKLWMRRSLEELFQGRNLQYLDSEFEFL